MGTTFAVYPLLARVSGWCSGPRDGSAKAGSCGSQERDATAEVVDDGGRRAAFIYSLIVTAKMNDIDPQAWLASVLARMPVAPV